MDEKKKAFDMGDLAAKLKAKGLPHVEGLAKGVVEAVFEWTEEGIKATPSQIDDFALGVLGPCKSLIIGKLDAIDGA